MGLHVFQIADNLAIAGANGGNVNFGMGQTRRLNCHGMSASPPTSDVWLRRSDLTLGQQWTSNHPLRHTHSLCRGRLFWHVNKAERNHQQLEARRKVRAVTDASSIADRKRVTLRIRFGRGCDAAHDVRDGATEIGHIV
jgi:hypothetical protein